MEKSVLLVSGDEGFRTRVAELVRGRGFICVTANSISDASEALKRAIYDLVLIDSNVGPELLVREFVKILLEHKQKVLVFVLIIPDWVGLEVPLILRTLVNEQLPDWMEKNG